MSIRKQIEALTSKRNGHLDAMTALNALSVTETRQLTVDEQTAFDKDLGEVRDIDGQLVRLTEYERQLGSRAEPAAAPGQALTPTPGVEVRAFKPFKGQGFVRLVLAVGRSKGNMMQAADFAMRWKDQTPEVEAVLRAIAQTGEMPSAMFRAAVAAGTTTHATWAGPLVYAQNLSSEFIDLLRPATIIGQLPLRPVPFNVSIPRQTAGVAAGWVGQGLSKPVGALSFDRLPIPWSKSAVIAVITQELARFSDPSAEMLVRDDLVKAIKQFLDSQFIDPAVAAVAALNPASITNGVTSIPSSGATITAINADLTKAISTLVAANMPMTSTHWIMNPTARIFLQNLRTVQEQYAFPEMGAAGLTLKGYPVVESTAVLSSMIILAECSEILLASDPVVDVTSSEEASLQMDSAPATPPTPLVSMFQQNMMAIKAEQFIYWVKRHTGCVTYISAFPTPTIAAADEGGDAGALAARAEEQQAREQAARDEHVQARPRNGDRR
jgi:HK97 family phage major capsid protein